MDWANTTQTLAAVPSLQVVAHALLMRGAPPHDKLFGLLKGIATSWVRHVPWQPAPLLGVAGLKSPPGTALCTGAPAPRGGVRGVG